MFSKDYEIKYYDKNLCGVLKESAILNLMQDVATLNANSLNFGQNFVEANGLAWAVIKYKLEFFEPLQNLETITLKTEPRGLTKLFAMRNFEIHANGKRLGRSSSTWVLININDRKIQPIKKWLPNLNDFVQEENDLNFEKIVQPEKYENSKEFTVVFDDIDTNKHANNSNYIFWALSSLPNDFRTNHAVKTMNLYFKKEVGIDEKIVSLSSTDGQTSTHLIKNATTDETLCELKIDWFCL